MKATIKKEWLDKGESTSQVYGVSNNDGVRCDISPVVWKWAIRPIQRVNTDMLNLVKD